MSSRLNECGSILIPHLRPAVEMIDWLRQEAAAKR